MKQEAQEGLYTLYWFKLQHVLSNYIHFYSRQKKGICRKTNPELTYLLQSQRPTEIHYQLTEQLISMFCGYLPNYFYRKSN